MLAILFLVLLATSLAAPFLGTDTSDARSEAAHPSRAGSPPPDRPRPPFPK